MNTVATRPENETALTVPEPLSIMGAAKDLPAVIPERSFDVTIGAEWIPSIGRGEILYLSWVPEDQIPERHREVVRHHVDRAAQMLGLPHLEIRWFGPAVNGGDFFHEVDGAGLVPAGFMPDDIPYCVAFNASARGEGLVAVIAHECRHILQRVLLAKLRTPERREEDADEFAALYMAREVI